MLKAGNSFTSTARQFGLNESTVRYIKKEEENIRKSASISFIRDAKGVVKTQNKTMLKMENVLSVWIQDCRQKKINLDINIIRAKAKSLYEFLKSEDGDEDYPQPSTSNQTSS